jgi:hypothetical protein
LETNPLNSNQHRQLYHIRQGRVLQNIVFPSIWHQLLLNWSFCIILQTTV